MCIGKAFSTEPLFRHDSVVRLGVSENALRDVWDPRGSRTSEWAAVSEVFGGFSSEWELS